MAEIRIVCPRTVLGRLCFSFCHWLSCSLVSLFLIFLLEKTLSQKHCIAINFAYAVRMWLTGHFEWIERLRSGAMDGDKLVIKVVEVGFVLGLVLLICLIMSWKGANTCHSTKWSKERNFRIFVCFRCLSVSNDSPSNGCCEDKEVRKQKCGILVLDSYSLFCTKFRISNEVGRPAELKHLNKRRKRN